MDAGHRLGACNQVWPVDAPCRPHPLTCGTLKTFKSIAYLPKLGGPQTNFRFPIAWKSQIWWHSAKGWLPQGASCALTSLLPVTCLAWQAFGVHLEWDAKRTPSASSEGCGGRRGPVKLERIGKRQEEGMGQHNTEKSGEQSRSVSQWGGGGWDGRKVSINKTVSILMTEKLLIVLGT